MQDNTIGDPREYSAELLRDIQEDWHLAPIVLGYDTVSDPLDLRGATVHGTGTEWIIEN